MPPMESSQIRPGGSTHHRCPRCCRHRCRPRTESRTTRPTMRMKPATTDTQIEVMMPLGPLRAASCVSSVMCAEASKPVMVYCASIMPTSATQMTLPLKPAAGRPVLLLLREHVGHRLVWSGAMKAARRARPTPIRCHQTQMSLIMATTLTPKRVDQPVQHQDDRVDQEQDLHGLAAKEDQGDRRKKLKNGRQTEVDRGGHRDLAEQVEPAGEPGPDGAPVSGGPSWPTSSTAHPQWGSWSRPRPWRRRPGNTCRRRTASPR